MANKAQTVQSGRSHPASTVGVHPIPVVQLSRGSDAPEIRMVDSAINRLASVMQRLELIEGEITTHLNRVLGQQFNMSGDESTKEQASMAVSVPDGSIHQLHCQLYALEHQTEALLVTVRRAEIL